MPVHCVGSSPAAFCLLLFGARKHRALLPPFVLLTPHEGMYHILFHDNSMVVECCVTLNDFVVPGDLSAACLMFGLSIMNF